MTIPEIILATMKPGRLYTAGDMETLAKVPRNSAIPVLKTLSRSGRVLSERLPGGDCGYRLPDA